MTFRFVAQGAGLEGNLHRFLLDVAENEDLTSLSIVVAWARDSGLSRISELVEQVNRRGTTRLILGIDEGGGTIEGLRSAADMFGEVFVYHYPSSGTFHPKVYLAEGSDLATAFVGSNNMTAGGLYRNCEAGVVGELDLSDPHDVQFVEGIRTFLGRLLDDSDVCRPLSNELLEQLISDSRYRIGPERRLRPGDPQSGSDIASTPSAFGRSRYPLTRDPAAAKSVPGEGVRAAQGTSVPAGSGQSGVSGAGTPLAEGSDTEIETGDRRAVKRWFKRMSASDAQQRQTEETNVTGNLKLTQAGHLINHEVYFRHDFFGPVTWSSEAKPKGFLETAEVAIEVYVDGAPLGTFAMVVDHADYRIAGQDNVPTWLKWKEFGTYLQGHDHRDDWVILERLSDGSFRLFIEPEPALPALL